MSKEHFHWFTEYFSDKLMPKLKYMSKEMQKIKNGFQLIQELKQTSNIDTKN